MGFFDDAIHESVPGGDLVKPLAIAAGALILGHLFSGKQEAAAPSATDPTPAQPSSGGGLLGELAGALGGALGGASAGGAASGGGATSGGGLLGNAGNILGELANSPLGGALAGAAGGTAVSSGLNSLLNQFRNAGQGAAADSWVGNGTNTPVTADQINQVIGHGKIAEIAQQAGISPDQMSQLLANALPKLIDKLTPGGQVPQS